MKELILLSARSARSTGRHERGRFLEKLIGDGQAGGCAGAFIITNHFHRAAGDDNRARSLGKERFCKPFAQRIKILKRLLFPPGLDPAGPLFESQDPRARLDASDARFVDVIHSNGEQLILGGLGSWQPMGDVDFYPNGGRMQSGCSNLFVGAVSDIIWCE